MQRGNVNQILTEYTETGWNWNPANNGRIAPTTTDVTGQTFGLTLGYAPRSWWSHELVLGQDVTGIAAYE